MFKKDLYITEISLSDFVQLHIPLRKLTMERENEEVHKYTTIEEDAKSLIDKNIEFYKGEGFKNVLLVTFKDDVDDGLQFIKYYTSCIQSYVIYPDCAGAYKKRNYMTFKFTNGEYFQLSIDIINKIYLIHI